MLHLRTTKESVKTTILVLWCYLWYKNMLFEQKMITSTWLAVQDILTQLEQFEKNLMEILKNSFHHL